MSISLALTLASATITAAEPSCSWDHPGRNPYRGSIAAAIDRYTDIPPTIASTLKRRMAENQPDDNVIITRDAITGREQYAPQIRAMHFGAASVCASVTRDGWSSARQEPAKVYCVGAVCIIVPRICGNISRVTRMEAPAKAKASYYGPPAGAKPQAGPAPERHALAADAQAAPASTIPLRSPIRPEPAATPAGEMPQLSVPEADTPAAVAQAEADGTQRNRLPGRTPVIWASTDDSWHTLSLGGTGTGTGTNGGGNGGKGNGAGNGSTITVPSAVPEPSGAATLALGLAMLALVRRLRRRR